MNFLVDSSNRLRVNRRTTWRVPNPHVANPGIAERAPWRSTKRGVAGVSSLVPSRPKLLPKISLQRKCFGAINFVKITKESLYKANSLACFLANRDKPVAATLQRKCSGGINFVIIRKDYSKNTCSKEFFCNNFGQDGRNSYRFLSFPMHLRHPRQTRVLTRTEDSVGYQGVSKGGSGTRQTTRAAGSGQQCFFSSGLEAETGGAESCENTKQQTFRIALRQDSAEFCGLSNSPLFFRKAPDTFNFLRHVTRAIWSLRPKCSHRCVSLKETSLKPVQILKHTTKNSAEQTAMRTKWFKHIAI